MTESIILYAKVDFIVNTVNNVIVMASITCNQYCGAGVARSHISSADLEL
jgi:hypothetical protein